MFSLLFQITREVRRNFLCDLGGAILFGLFFGGFNSFILVQARRLGATTFEVGLLAALPSIWLLLSPVWAKKFHNENPYKMVFLADGTSRALIFLLLFNSSAYWYILLFAIFYFFSSISITIYGKAMQQAYPMENRGTLMGWVRVGSVLAQIVSIAFTGIFLPIWGVQYLFAFLAIFGVGSAITFSQMKQAITEPPRISGPRISAFEIYKKDQQYRQFMIALFFFGLATAITLTAYPLFQVDFLKISDQFISTFAMIIFCSSLVFYYIGGFLIDRFSPVKVAFMVFLVNLSIPVVFFFTLNQWPLLLIALMQGIVNAGVDLIILNCVLCMAKEGEINSYMALNIYLQGVRGTLGPLLAPLLINFLTYKGLFTIVFILNLVGIWQLLPLIKRPNFEINDTENLTVAGTD